jgi:hypothetical protein
MADVVVRRRRDGVLAISRRRRARWALHALAALLVVGPLVLSIVALLPPVLLAIPPMTLWVVVWVIFRGLDRPERPHATSPPGPGSVVPLRLVPGGRPGAALHTCKR